MAEKETTDRGLMDSISLEEMGKAAELLQSIAKPAMNMIFEAIPHIIKFSRAVYSFYKKLPILYVTLIIGFVMCFFGGIYPTLFAALQVSDAVRSAFDFFGPCVSYFTFDYVYNHRQQSIPVFPPSRKLLLC